MNGTHYFSEARDFDRLELFENLDVITCGKGTSPDAVERLQKEFPDKLIGLYYACAFELNATEQATYPGPMSNRITGVGRVVGLMDDATVAWHAERAAEMVGSAHFLMSDNSDPKNPIGDPTKYTSADVANWREYVPKTMAAIKAAIGSSDARLVANVGHSLNPSSVSNPALRDCYAQMCGSVHGIGIEKRTGVIGASYLYNSFLGPYLSPRLSIAFAQDAAAWVVTDGMLLPSYVVKSVVKWVLVAGGA